MTTNDDAVKQALVAIRELKAELDARDARDHEPIAIVGMGTRLPGPANRPDELWRALVEGRDLIGPVPPDRWTPEGFRDHPVYPLGDEQIEAIRWGGFIDDIDAFDADFFALSPREVRSMDPQQRLLLEVVQHALDDGNLTIGRDSPTRVGTFMATGPQEYGLAMLGRFQDAHVGTGCAPSASSGRIGHFFGFEGPAMTVDTACSSALVAIHLAVQSLRRDESELAVVGAANIMVAPLGQYTMAQLGALSMTGRCRSFAASADGYVRGEGAGAVVLKRLSDATADGDPIRAVILGSAVNHDGRSSGLTVPNQRAQQDVIDRALADAERTPAEVGFVETHGTGTPLGDPIELAALDAAYGADRRRPLAIGSVKTNLGHLEQAAGMAGLQKLALSIERGERAPHLHWDGPNPRFDWEAGSIDVVTERRPWTDDRLGSISGFGFTGTNAHLVLGPAPAAQPAAAVGGEGKDTQDHGRDRLLVLSAGSDGSLRDTARSHADLLAPGPSTAPTDVPALSGVTSAAATGRTHRRHRLAVVEADREAMASRLRRFADGDDRAADGHRHTTSALRLGMVFSGQGSQRPAMGAELYADQPVFARVIDECDAVIGDRLGDSLVSLLTDPELGAGRLDDTEVTQPALFAFELALARLWRSWGIEPDVVAGHSIGEYVAAAVAGVFDPAAGLELVLARGRLMGALPSTGGMVSVLGPPAAVERALADAGHPVDVAAYNGPRNVVLAGDQEPLAAMEQILVGEGLTTSPLPVSQAFHSRLMEPMLEEFRAVTETIPYRRPDRLVVSSTTGEVIGAELATPDHWVRHVRRPVRFDRAVTTMAGEDCDLLLEVGPTSPLTGLARSVLGEGSGHDDVEVVGSLHRGSSPAGADLLRALGYVWTAGAQPELGVAVGRDRSVRLPPSSFHRRPFWFRTDRRVDVTEIGPTAGTLVEPAPTGRLGNLHRSPSRQHRYERRIAMAGHDPDPNPDRGNVPDWDIEVLAMAATASATHGIGLANLSLPTPIEPGHDHDILLTTVDPERADGGVTIVSPIGDGWRQHLRADVDDRVDLGRLEVDPADQADATVHDVAGDDWARSLGLALSALDDRPARIVGAARIEVHSFDHRRLVVTTAVSADQTVLDLDWVGADGAVVSRLRGLVCDTSPAAEAERWANEVVWVPIAPTPRSDRGGSAEPAGGTDDDPDRLAATIVDGRLRLGYRRTTGGPEATEIADPNDPNEVAEALEATIGSIPRDHAIRVTYQPGPDEAGPAGLLTLVAGLRDRTVERLTVVTVGAAEVEPGDPVDPHAAAVWAMATTLAVEFGHWPVRLVDLDPTDPGSAASWIDAGRHGTAVAHRGDRVLRPELRRSMPAPGMRADIRQDRTYLVTGGLGGLGTVLATWLAARGAGRIILAGRSAPDQETTTFLAGLPQADRIETRGLDVTDPTSVEALVTSIGTDGPPLAGLFHLAGAEDGDLLVDQHPRRLHQLLGPKLNGTRNLDRATASLDLDHFVCFSSASVLLPTPGLGTYAAANAAMEAVCANRRAAGGNALSVAWGPWSGSGMATRLPAERWAEAGVDLIDPEVGTALLDRFMGGRRSSVAVLTLDPDRLAGRFAGTPRTEVTREAISPEIRRAIVRLRDDDAEHRRQTLDRYLQELVGIALGTDRGERLPGNRSLFEQGLDSLMALEMRNRIETDLQVPIGLADFLEEPTLDRLLVMLDGQIEAGVPAVALPTVRSGDQSADDLAPDADVEAMLASIEHLSDAEVEAMLRSVEAPGEGP